MKLLEWIWHHPEGVDIHNYFGHGSIVELGKTIQHNGWSLSIQGSNASFLSAKPSILSIKKSEKVSEERPHKNGDFCIALKT